MVFFITAKIYNLAKVFLLLSSRRLGVIPYSWDTTFLAFLHFLVNLFLLFFPSLIAFNFFDFSSLFGLVSFILDLALKGYARFLLSLFRLIVLRIKAYFQEPFSFTVPLIQMDTSLYLCLCLSFIDQIILRHIFFHISNL